MERITKACVKCRAKDGRCVVNAPQDSEGYIYASGPSHDYCYDSLYYVHDMPVRALPDQYDIVEGFLCGSGDFVDRVSAMKIASDAGQLQSMYANGDYLELKSYMLK